MRTGAMARRCRGDGSGGAAITLPARPALSVAEYGEPAGIPLVYLHAHPGGRVEP
jgi:hypothetical protein